MRYANVGEILSGNGDIRKELLDVVAGISDHQAAIVPQGENWSIRQILEHLAMVDQGVARICGRLISEAKRNGKMSDGRLVISPEFKDRAKRIAEEKVEAPEQVQPTGTVSIAESIEMLKKNEHVFESMRQDLETYDLSEPTFPHPYFGGLTAVEWLIVSGGHETRHTQQIQRLLQKIEQ